MANSAAFPSSPEFYITLRRSPINLIFFTWTLNYLGLCNLCPLDPSARRMSFADYLKQPFRHLNLDDFILVFLWNCTSLSCFPSCIQEQRWYAAEEGALGCISPPWQCTQCIMHLTAMHCSVTQYIAMQPNTLQSIAMHLNALHIAVKWFAF